MNSEVDHLYLDRASCRTLLAWLRDFAWLARELENVTTRQTRYVGPSERKAAETPVVFNPAASDLAGDVVEVFFGWAASVAEVRGLPMPAEDRRSVAGLAGWLREHVMDLAQIEPARDAYDEIRELHRKAMRMVDRPEEQEFVGPCQSDVDGVECSGVYARRGADTKNCVSCGVCVDIPAVMAATHETLVGRQYTERELVQALKVVLRRTVPRQTVRRWVVDGKLERQPSGLFELGPALELAEKAHRRGRPAEDPKM